MSYTTGRVYNFHQYTDFFFCNREVQSKKVWRAQVQVVNAVGVRNVAGLYYLSVL